MQPITTTARHARDLYWLAFLLTGRRESSVDLAVESLKPGEGCDGFFSNWMLKWSRKVVISKALAAIRGELAESARRTGLKRREHCPQAAPKPFHSVPGRAELERALLAIDVFPRCAVVLSIFEGMSLDDTTTLLDGDRDLVRKAQHTGLMELARNLAGIGELQHA